MITLVQRLTYMNPTPKAPYPLILIFFWLLASCIPARPITIGFSAQLTGRQGEIGVASRNGAELAIEQINNNGGVNGRQITLIVVDDHGDPEIAREEDQKLIDQGVAAVIGHTTSEQTAAVFDMFNLQKTILISPTSSSQSFSAKDDFFFRNMSDNKSFAYLLARKIHDAGAQKVVCIYDLANRAFTESYWLAMESEFQKLGTSSQVYSFISGKSNLELLMKEVAAQQPDAIAYISSATDAALMAQYGRQMGVKAKLYGNTWAYTNELIEKGGRAVEGMELVGLYNPEYPSDKHRQFIEDFQHKYGKKPSLGASHSYEAMMILAAALRQTNGEKDGLRDALKGIKNFEGLLDPISFDEYGDVHRKIYIVRVENGSFVITGTVDPE